MRSLEQAERESTLPSAAIKFTAKAPQAREMKKNFPERLWSAAMAGGQSESGFWVNGARFAEDGSHIFYSATVLAAKLGVKPGTIAHNIRGHLGSEKPYRMDKKTFERHFGSMVPYCGQVWVIRIPRLDVTTRDFRQFRWGRQLEEMSVSGEEYDDAIWDDDPGSGSGSGSGIAAVKKLVCWENPQVVDWSILEEEDLRINFGEVKEFPAESSFLPEHWNV
jgi:hypothetical protein